MTTFAYWLTWVALLLLTATTFGLSYANLGPADLTVVLAIAAVKTMLVSLVFMHLAKSAFGYRFVLLVGILFVVIMLSLTLLDRLTRGGPGVVPPLRGEVPGAQMER